MSPETQETINHLIMLCQQHRQAYARENHGFKQGMIAAMHEDPEHVKFICRVTITKVYHNTFGEEVCDIQSGFYIRKGILSEHLDRIALPSGKNAKFLRSVLVANIVEGGKC